MKIMKKIFLALFIVSTFLFSAKVATSQTTFGKGDNLISFGIGAAHNYSGYNAGLAPSFRFTYDLGIIEAGPGVISAGGMVGYSSHTYKYWNNNDQYKWTWTTFGFAARGAYHMDWDVENLDTYAGLELGVRFVSFKEKKPDNASSTNNIESSYRSANKGHAGVYVGASYFFADDFGAFAELGYSFSSATIGLCFRF